MRSADGLVQVEVGVLVGDVEAVVAEVADELGDGGLPHLVAESVQRSSLLVLACLHTHVLQLALPAVQHAQIQIHTDTHTDIDTHTHVLQIALPAVQHAHRYRYI